MNELYSRFREHLIEAVTEFTQIDCSLFTTFSINPSFFENNILPILFNVENSIEIKRRYMINDKLSTSPCAVLYDYSTQPSGGNNYRYQIKGISIKGRFFHPKNIIIAGYDVSGQPMIIVYASSANLTLQTWANNEEVFSFLVISSKKQQAYSALMSFSLYLRDKLGCDKIDSLQRLIKFLENMPDGRIRHPEFNGDLYFSSIMEKGKGFPEFLNQNAIMNRDKLTVFSPFWGDDFQELINRFKVNSIIFKPAYFDELKSYGFNSEQVKELKSIDNLRIERVPESKEGYRFRHAKAYLLYSNRTDNVRFGIGSCNFTLSGLSGNNGNVESMIVYEIDNELAQEFDKENKELDLSSYIQVKPDEEGVRAQPPFYIMVTLDWSRRLYEIDFSKSPELVFNKCLLKVPGIKEKIDLLNISSPPDYHFSISPSSTNSFEVIYRLDDMQSDDVFKGLIYETELRYSERNYLPRLSIYDIFESWKHHSDHWVEKLTVYNSAEFSDDSTDSDNSEELNQDINGDIFSYYEMYRSFYDRYKTVDEAVTQEEIDRILITRPDSLYKLVLQLKTSDVDLISRFLILKECDIIRKMIKSKSNVKIDPEFSKLLNNELSATRKCVSKALSDNEKDRVGNLKLIDENEAVNWLEKEIEKVWNK